MSKQHTTMKHIRQVWGTVWQCGYCDLQYIMRGTEPQYYNSGVYGWNCDIYCDYKRDVAITTGYRNMRGRMIPDSLIKKYSDIAEEICKDTWNKSYSEIREALDQNRENFFDELANI